MRTRTLSSMVWLMRVQILNELQYRANFFMQLLRSVLSIGTSLVLISLVFHQVSNLNGWTRPQLFVFLGVYTLVAGVLQMFVRPTLESLVRDVREGTFDFVLTKPIDTQFLVSARAVQIWEGVDVLAGAALIAWGAIQLDGLIQLRDFLVFVVTLALGLVVIYCFLFCLMSSSFWLVRTEGIGELFESLYQAGRWPLSIYPGWLRFALTFVVPIGFSVSLPASALLSRLSGRALFGELIVAAAFALFTRYFFRIAVRHYTGASS